jgi:hypothetical protein
LQNDDPWWQILGLVEGFNENWQSMVAAGKWKVLDESMSAWHPQKTKTGGLPHISFIMRKPEPLGTEFKVVACPQTGLFLYLEIQRGKEDMQQMKYHCTLGATMACTIRGVEVTKHCGQ